MSDIVERLYAWPAVEKHSDALSSQHIGALMEEAAKEIERLREALEDLLSDVERQMLNPSHHQPFSYQKAKAALRPVSQQS